MEQLLICLSLALIAGLLMSRLAKVVRLPAVTSYLVAGLLLGPYFLGKLGLTAAGEIEPEGRTSARTANKPEAPVTLD